MNTVPKNAYIDVRGPHPLLVVGLRVWAMEGHPRSITPQEAWDLVTLEQTVDEFGGLDNLLSELDQE